MTSEQKSLIISQISLLLDQMVEAPAKPKAPVKDGPREMLTTKECLETVKGLSFHTLRVLIAKNRRERTWTYPCPQEFASCLF